MSTITVVNHVTLDGVMQAPGRPDEDERGGFGDGGWAPAGNDPVMGRVMGEVLMIHPRVLGAGRRLFAAGAPASLRLRDSVTTRTGVIIATDETIR